jgi:uncharacterized protein (DUF2384 family)
MSFRNEMDRLLTSDDAGGVEKALRVLADAVDTLWAERAKAERLQELAEQGFAQGLKGE